MTTTVIVVWFVVPMLVALLAVMLWEWRKEAGS